MDLRRLGSTTLLVAVFGVIGFVLLVVVWSNTVTVLDLAHDILLELPPQVWSNPLDFLAGAVVVAVGAALVWFARRRARNR